MPLIIDEIQYAPSLLGHVKARIDADRRPGRYFLAGSHVFPFMEGVSESLAGRCGVLELYTLGRSELERAGLAAAEEERVFRGGYPEPYGGAEEELWFPSYVATYLERDVRNVLRVADLQEFHRFLRACALRSAQVLNYSDLARDTGIAPNTARKWVGLLQTSSVVALVEPYFGDRAKRLIKAPKLVFKDTGLAAFLAGFRSKGDLFASPCAGAFWESYAYGQVARLWAGRGRPVPLYYWRTASGHEVDLVLELGGGEVLAVECRWKEHPTLRDAAGLQALEGAERGRVVEKVILCRTAQEYRLPDGTRVTHMAGLLERLEKLLQREPSPWRKRPLHGGGPS